MEKAFKVLMSHTFPSSVPEKGMNWGECGDQMSDGLDKSRRTRLDEIQGFCDMYSFKDSETL